MPLNTPADVARYIIHVTAEPQTHGKALFVTGGNAVDIEQGLAETQPQWLGEKNHREFTTGQEILGLVSFGPCPTALVFFGISPLLVRTRSLVTPLILEMCNVFYGEIAFLANAWCDDARARAGETKAFVHCLPKIHG